MADIKSQVKNGIDAAGDASKQAAGAGKDLINRVADTASDLAGKVQDRAKDVVGAVQDKAQMVADHVSDTAREGWHQAERVGEHAQEYGQELVDLVRKYPLPALLIGFGAGFLVSRAVSK